MEVESKMDALMGKIKKQVAFKAIKEYLKKNPKLAQLLPFLRGLLKDAVEQSDNYLGDADKIIIIGRLRGITRIMIVDGKKEFNISTGLKMTVEKSGLLLNEEINSYLKEIGDGLFNEITEEQEKAYLESKENGGGIESFIEKLKASFIEPKQITSAE